MSRATDVGAEDTKDPSETYQGLGYAVKTSCMLLNCDHAQITCTILYYTNFWEKVIC